MDWSKEPDRLCFKRKSTTRPASRSPIEDTSQGFNGSKDQIHLTNQRTTESTIRQISKPTESTMLFNQPLVCNLLAQVPLPEKVNAESGLFTLGNNTHVDKLLSEEGFQDADEQHFADEEGGNQEDLMKFQHQHMNNLQLHGSSTSSGLTGSMQTAGAATEMRNSKLAILNLGMVNSLDSDFGDAQM